MKRIFEVFLGAWFLCGMLVACGSGPNKRFVTRPDDYNKMIAFPSDGNPVDIRGLESEYPELKGIVMTAPEYIEEYERILKEKEVRGEGTFTYRIGPGVRLKIDVVGEPGLSEEITVPPTGEWYFAFGMIRLQGNTIESLVTILKERLRAFGLREPNVRVNILPGSPTLLTTGGAGPLGATTTGGVGEIIVMGAVGTRFFTNIQFTGTQTLVSVLGQTGLPGNSEWRQIRVIRRDPIDPLRKSRVIICDMWNYFALADVRQDIPLFPGDVVYVPIKWTFGDQFQKDWKLVLDYMNDAFFIDRVRDAFRKGGEFRNP